MQESRQPGQAGSLLLETDLTPSSSPPFTPISMSNIPTVNGYPRPHLLMLVLIAVVTLAIFVVGWVIKGYTFLSQMLSRQKHS